MGKEIIDDRHPLYKHFLSKRSVNYNNYPMGGNVYPVGIYWVEVELGTPPQAFQVAVDSGSTDLLVPSKDCKGCHIQNTGSFDKEATSTLNDVGCFNTTIGCHKCSNSQCEFINSYQTCNLTDPQQTCSVTGLIYSDIFTMGDLAADAIFGLIETQTENFQQFFVIDGLIGLAFNGGSSWAGQSAFEYLVQAGEVTNEFAMCMNGTSGGVLTLGTPDPSLYTGPFQYTPLISGLFNEYVLYTIKLTDIKVDGSTIGVASSKYTSNPFGGCVVDSGTNVILLPSDIYNPFQTTFKSQLCPGFNVPGVCDDGLFDGTCYEYTDSQVSQFPNITMDINGVNLNVPPQNYLAFNGTASYRCFGVLNTGVFGNLIIGDVVMESYYVHFDRINHRLGWADVNAENCIGQNTTIYY